ncbi:4-hydroxybenzoate polyprenyltransferase [Actinacidiphila oryziradicis]|uniref:4-hydroxybenzoate polyprenyltransferase n=1 Tax=Actinacidiphila oryziradicis TaxID=2571141 RepID=A0A4U0RPM9_9ACTN|nr:UbiA family prenyltransferase [Actinacidiphila oryziradicis]TJZ97903.1 4-hydroxybenzoate polyprenyltransferase [Actinacidiphila oryziradicis]
MTGPRDLAELIRAPAALSVPGDALAGAAAAGVLSPRSAGLALASTALYWAGMAANDWADRNLDAQERPERPIPSGRVSPDAALALSAGLTAAGVCVAGLAGGRRALVVATALAGAVWTYDLRAKGGPAGPAVMAACRGLDVLLGASPGPYRRALPEALTVAAHTWTVTALSRGEVRGAPKTLPASTLAATAVVAGALAGSAGRGSAPAAASVALACWYAADYGGAQARAVNAPTAARVRGAVAAGITALPALQGALIARRGHRGTALAVAAGAVAGRILGRKVSPT